MIKKVLIILIVFIVAGCDLDSHNSGPGDNQTTGEISLSVPASLSQENLDAEVEYYTIALTAGNPSYSSTITALPGEDVSIKDLVPAYYTIKIDGFITENGQQRNVVTGSAYVYVEPGKITQATVQLYYTDGELSIEIIPPKDIDPHQIIGSDEVTSSIVEDSERSRDYIRILIPQSTVYSRTYGIEATIDISGMTTDTTRFYLKINNGGFFSITDGYTESLGSPSDGENIHFELLPDDKIKLTVRSNQNYVPYGKISRDLDLHLWIENSAPGTRFGSTSITTYANPTTEITEADFQSTICQPDEYVSFSIPSDEGIHRAVLLLDTGGTVPETFLLTNKEYELSIPLKIGSVYDTNINDYGSGHKIVLDRNDEGYLMLTVSEKPVEGAYGINNELEHWNFILSGLPSGYQLEAAYIDVQTDKFESVFPTDTIIDIADTVY